MTKRWLIAGAMALGVGLTWLGADSLAAMLRPGDAYVWDLPEGMPPPRVPADNPMTQAKVTLGRHLFYDERLSVTGEMSCASCHRQELAFTDGKARGVGTTGEVHPRGPMSLANVAYAPRFTWAHPHLDRLEHQALAPLFGDDPVEMGMGDHEDELVARLAADPATVARFAAAFPDDAEPITVPHLVQAIASFERTMLSFDSPYDRYTRGDLDALSVEAQRGMKLFFSERLECFHCHGGPTFSDALTHAKLPAAEVAFHNTGLYNVDGEGGYPAPNTGIHAVTGDPDDMGRFKAPTLRNITVTAPYMHDGSLATLDDVLDHYAEGGRAGLDHPIKSEFVMGFVLGDDERADLLAFLASLTDTSFLTDPRLADPEGAR